MLFRRQKIGHRRPGAGVKRGVLGDPHQTALLNRAGDLHHLCLRARNAEDVDKVGEKLRNIGAVINRGPPFGDFALGDYYIVFEDPDGFRLKVHYVPGKGLLAGADGTLVPSENPNWDQNPLRSWARLAEGDA